MCLLDLVCHVHNCTEPVCVPYVPPVATEVAALTPDEFAAAEARVTALVRAAASQTERFLSKMTRNRAAAVRLGVPLYGVADNEETRALFGQYDTNGNGFIGVDEVQALAAALLPGEPWDDALWPSMCAEYGVTAELGFDYPAFVAFKTDAEVRTNKGENRLLNSAWIKFRFQHHNPWRGVGGALALAAWGGVLVSQTAHMHA
eukprot:COSAG05_NODE_790_length_7320_cov_14.861654_3_plen_203_part_00